MKAIAWAIVLAGFCIGSAIEFQHKPASAKGFDALIALGLFICFLLACVIS